MTMLANRLKILLAERDLSIKEVVDATKISRNALSNMINNPTANISTINIDRLCNYLQISPKLFFEYAPFLTQLSSADPAVIDENENTFVFTIKNGEVETSFYINVYAYTGGSLASREVLGGKDTSRYGLVFVFDFDADGDKDFSDFYNSLPFRFQKGVTKDLILYFKDQFIGDNLQVETEGIPSVKRNLKELFPNKSKQISALAAFDFPNKKLYKEFKIKF